MAKAKIAEESDIFSCCTILLLDADEERGRYLQNILEFVDYKLQQLPGVDGLEELLQQQAGELTAIFLGPDLTSDELQNSIEIVENQERKIPMFELLDANSGKDEANAGSAVLSTLALPCRHEVLQALLHKAQLYMENAATASENGKRKLELFRSLSGNSRATQKINHMISQVADTEATVLILGESGTGKEVVARKLHYQSERRGKPFVPVNCGAIPSDLLESELFGHEKGSFTGAINARQGRFELADGGTLFLDEIGDMSLPMQVKLLRVLQERSFERVGSNKTIQCNVRIIAATHRDLEESIRQDKFREDLYYRLNVFPIKVPPLRDRMDDLPVLITDLIARMEKEKRGSVRLTPATVYTLGQYSWPGNVRELANLIERLAILYPYGVVDVKELPEKFRAGVELPPESTELLIGGTTVGDVIEMAPRLPQEGLDLKAHLGEVEKNLIRQALDESGGVVAHAAKRLHMRRTTLVEKLRKYGLQRTTE
jgi:sigma-54 specific flagellar transcriptional regulator A